MNYQYRVLYSIQYLVKITNIRTSLTMTSMIRRSVYLLTYLLKYVWAEINGLDQLWPWPGLGVELTALAFEPVALLTSLLPGLDAGLFL